MSATQYRIGVDVGGTFTDLIAVPEDGGALVPGTPRSPGDGVPSLHRKVVRGASR